VTSLGQRVSQQFHDLKAEGQHLDSQTDHIMRLEMEVSRDSPEVHNYKTSKEAFCIRSIQLVKRLKASVAKILRTAAGYARWIHSVATMSIVHSFST
jgi:hypothetical protein